MEILLTGHKGFIGSHLLKALQEAGHEVETYDWHETYRPDVFGKDWVIHIGGNSSTTERDVEKIMRQNYDFTCRLYRECKTFGVNFQFASSASIYGLVSTFREDAPVDPRTPYAWSKYLCERYIMQNMGGITTQLFRYFNVYGPEGEEHKGSQASPFMQFTKQAKENGVIKLFENSDKYERDFIHIDEIVQMHMRFMEKPVSGIFNMGRGKTMSFQEVGDFIAKTHKAKLEYIPMPEILKSSYQTYTKADMTKTRQALSS